MKGNCAVKFSPSWNHESALIQRKRKKREGVKWRVIVKKG